MVLAFGYDPFQTITVCLPGQSGFRRIGSSVVPKVYVGNLASSVTSSDLLVHFSRAGEVRQAQAINNPNTWDLLEKIKRLLDPQGVMNPGALGLG